MHHAPMLRGAAGRQVIIGWLFPHFANRRSRTAPDPDYESPWSAIFFIKEELTQQAA